MELGDARKLTQDIQESPRFRAAEVLLIMGVHALKTARLLGVAQGTVPRLLSSYKNGTENSLRKKKHEPVFTGYALSS